MKNYRFLSIATLLIGLFAFTACTDNDGTGTMTVSLTDAPADFDAVNIEVLEVLVNQNGNAPEPAEGVEDTDGKETANGWYAIMDEPMMVNLLDYQNGQTLDLGEVELEAGRYNQIRLVLGDNNTITVNGETVSLTTPSAQQSGYKLNVQADVEEGQVYDLVIDFDAGKSITKTGNGSYILKPVLRTVNLREQASISGTVLPLDSETSVYAITGTDTVATTIPNEEGNFTLIGLDNVSYNVWFSPSNTAYADSLVEGIELETAEQYVFDEAVVLEASN